MPGKTASPNFLSTPCTAFSGNRRIAKGELVEVALAIKAAETEEPVLTFNDMNGAVIDLDLRGTTAEIITRLTKEGERRTLAAAPHTEEGPESTRPRGRPRLGVVAREVTLLPRHWEWLAAQPGGASQALRRLVEKARHADNGQTETKAARERTYRFLSALAGDLPGFENVIRALFAGEEDVFAHRMETWPEDIKAHAQELLHPSFQQ
ncbi:DUF2239 family protein [Acetobacter farinalis]|uniref:DUF2239 family protein n=1 Tax=Acetobacter farinalis TaxID=1260984 RepID=A0ABT3QAF2_9PROT|nr:DUF2239 family protein [Acetobacter farinalis]MCX2562251.1 DUF2239 family protein [Acetobacter farinalis]NHO30871.1 DUF2239 family protein [Acetobacter farinalis]